MKTSPYGRCVFRCDNDVCDNQVSLIRFKNGVTVSFNLSGFTNKMCRTLKVMCENGEIHGDDGLNRIEVIPFASNQADGYESRVITPRLTAGAHGGGDSGLMEDFLNILSSGSGCADSRSSINRSVESHIMAYAAEQSRISGKIVDIDSLKQKLMRG